ncbi:MAG: hypothetical protein GF355_07785 [Candidatus Eisenbacteria bacterium]|nr:hypothetical protein [Candidatus Eisenbacteria bacterium]
MRTLLLGTCLTILISPAALGQMIVHESWEGDYTLLGMLGSGSPPIIAEAVADTPTDPVHGQQVLQLIHNSPGDTPQGFVA